MWRSRRSAVDLCQPVTAAVASPVAAPLPPADDAEPGTAYVVLVGDVPGDAAIAAGRGVAKPATAGDPYAGVVRAGRLARDGHDVLAVVIALASLQRGEAAVIRTFRQYHPSAEIFVTSPKAGATTLAEAILYGADALIAGGQIHPFHDDGPTLEPVAEPPPMPTPAPQASDPTGGPLLSGAELEALLGDFDEDE